MHNRGVYYRYYRLLPVIATTAIFLAIVWGCRTGLLYTLLVIIISLVFSYPPDCRRGVRVYAFLRDLSWMTGSEA